MESKRSTSPTDLNQQWWQKELPEVITCRNTMTNFLQLATDKYEEITKKLTSLSAEKEKLLELMRKSHTVQGQEATQKKISSVRSEIKDLEANKLKVKVILQSSDMSACAATAGLNGADFDLWTNLYSFVVERMQSAIYKLDHTA